MNTSALDHAKETNDDLVHGPLPAGTVAPDFSLYATPDQQLSLSELKGNPVRRFWVSRLIAPGVIRPLPKIGIFTSACWPISSPKGLWHDNMERTSHIWGFVSGRCS